MNAANNHPSVQNAKNTVMNGKVRRLKLHNTLGPQLTTGPDGFREHAHDPLLNLTGPVAQNVKAEGAKTRDEFADLANSKTIPEQKTATGQNLTRTSHAMPG